MKDKTCGKCKNKKAIAYSKIIGYNDVLCYYCEDCLKERQLKSKESVERTHKEFEKEMKDKWDITLTDNCVCGEEIQKEGRFMRRMPTLCYNCQGKLEEEIINKHGI